MRKTILILAVLFTAVVSANAQGFDKTKFNLDLGYAFGSHAGAFYSPGVLVSFEKGVHKWIGVGGYAGYQYNFYAGNIFGWNGYNRHSIPLGVSGAFHFYQMIGDLVEEDIEQDKLDIALKTSFGIRLDILQHNLANNYKPKAYFDFGVSAQLRYFFTESFGVYTEVGYPAMGGLVVGMAFKF